MVTERRGIGAEIEDGIASGLARQGFAIRKARPGERADFLVERRKHRDVYGILIKIRSLG
jgi:hypothetical protein